MELQRGICSLCADSTKVLSSSDSEEFSQSLPELFYDNYLTKTEFQKLKKVIKVCTICCFKIQTAIETKKRIRSCEDEIDREDKVCYFCKADKCLMKIDPNWKYFTVRTENHVKPIDFPLCVCPKCLFFFDVIYSFKTKLSYKFPKLLVQKKKSETFQTRVDTPKRKLISKSPPSSKKRKFFDNCFDYLQPLCKNTFRVAAKLKRDKTLYRKIAYVNLTNSKDISVKETPKQRPIIKIKLRPKSKRNEKESKTESLKKDKSEEPPTKRRRSLYLERKSLEAQENKVEAPEAADKSNQHKSKKGKQSCVEKSKTGEKSESTIEETPKSGATSNLVPKRRVSKYMGNGENEEKKESEEEDEERKESEEEEEKKESEEEEDKKESEEEEEDKSTSDEISAEEKPSSPAEKDTSSSKEEEEEPTSPTGEEKTDSPAEDNNKDADSHKNGVEDSDPDADKETEDFAKISNGDKSEETTEETVEEKSVTEKNVEDTNSPEQEDPMLTPRKNKNNSEGSDSDSNDNKEKSMDVSESDALNGSERKKKKVTFCDEIND